MNMLKIEITIENICITIYIYETLQQIYVHVYCQLLTSFFLPRNSTKISKKMLKMLISNFYVFFL